MHFVFRSMMRLITSATQRNNVKSATRHELSEIDRRLRSALTAFFARRTGNRTEAEDLTQDVFYRLARSDAASSQLPDAYIFQIAANLLRDKARRDKVRADYGFAKSLEDYVGIDIIDPFVIASNRQDLRLLARMITQLPDKTRRIFTLYRLENIDKPAIAASFGLSVRMVEIHIQRALAVLADGLGESR